MIISSLLKEKLLKIKKLVIVVSMPILIGLSLGGCKLFPKEEAVVAPALIKPPKVTYKTVKAVKGDITSAVRVYGKFVSVKQYDYAFSARSGYIKTLNFKAGDIVKKGDILAELDSEVTAAQLQQAEIRLKKAELIYNAINNNSSSTDYDKALSALDLQSAQLDVQAVKSELAKTKLVSDVNGRIVFAADVKIGQQIGAFSTIYSIADVNDLQVEYNGPRAAEFKLGMKVSLVHQGKSYQGEVVATPETVPKDAAGNRNSLKDMIRVKMDEIPTTAKFGDDVEVFVEMDKRIGAVKIPRQLVRVYDGVPYVQILENNSKIERFIEVGIHDGEFIEVVRGVSEGEEIIME